MGVRTGVAVMMHSRAAVVLALAGTSSTSTSSSISAYAQ